MTEDSPRRHCEARINLDAIRANYNHACQLAPDSRAIAVVKADAYGHGAVAVARALCDLTPAFAVGFIDEALELREAGILEPILLLEGVTNAAALAAASEHELSVVVHDPGQVDLFESVAVRKPVPAWLKVDTGMHRLGLAPGSVRSAYERLAAAGSCARPIVLCTHLATADRPGSRFVEQQLALFDACVEGIDAPRSIANSGAILAFPETHRDWNRPGYMLYGGSPFEQKSPATRPLVPAMTLESEVIGLHDVPAGDSVGYGLAWTARSDARIATVAIGYADGYPRHAPSGTPTWVRGRIAPLAGVVSMDMIAIDVSDIGDVKVGDRVVLWGEDLPVDTVARAAGTLGYELLTGVSGRVPRRYVGGQG